MGVGVLWLMVPAVLTRACRPAAQGEQEHDQRDEPAWVHGSSIPEDTRECHDCCSMGPIGMRSLDAVESAVENRFSDPLVAVSFEFPMFAGRSDWFLLSPRLVWCQDE